VRDRRDPRSHWGLVGAALLVLVALLSIAHITGGTQGERARHLTGAANDTPVPLAVLHGGPVLDARRPAAAGMHIPDRTIALTFDDGPSAYTRQILDVLAEFHVPATFFVIGSRVSERSAIVRRIVRAGHDVGLHTFTHPDLGASPAWRERVELDATQLTIAATTGHTTNLLRMPFSSTPDALTAPEWRAIARAGNYRVVLADLDTRDWARPGTTPIVRAGTPRGHAGAIVMMHDGGGDRSQTVAALKQLIPLLLRRGYRFETVSQALGVGSPWEQASRSQQIRGFVLIGSVVIGRWLVRLLLAAFLLAAALAVCRVAILLMFARRHATRFRRQLHFGRPPGVSIIVPAYNERVGIAACIRSLVASDYPRLEVIVVDDGSDDETAAVVRALDLAEVRLIRQANAGKPAALNRGIAAARYDVLVMVDGDTVFEAATLRQLVEYFTDPAVGAVSGNAKVGNRRGFIGRSQHIEYVMGFNLDRRMYDVLRCMPTVPGAVGAFRKDAIRAIGGVSSDTLAEDTDLSMALCRAGWRVVYAPEARAWTEAPATIGQLWRQRYRWCYGTLQSIWKHRRSVIESGASGRLGRRGIPYLLTFQVGLPLLAPVIDIVAIVGLFTGDARAIGLIWLAFLGVQYVGAIYSFVLDNEPLSALWALPVQQVVYRQLMYLVVIQSLASAAYGAHLRWHKLRRIGSLESAPEATTDAPILAHAVDASHADR
jgi:cellulose synthase/poly-beta-1,6-N-acetylglucosamine synthase-like glycosyltransferase/peptidoglycan/xylan/chitin deacetylase (PgdA/CDA1 family)